jgi:DNA-directed RNA polymerase subunit RPC12/RpoP
MIRVHNIRYLEFEENDFTVFKCGNCLRTIIIAEKFGKMIQKLEPLYCPRCGNNETIFLHEVE